MTDDEITDDGDVDELDELHERDLARVLVRTMNERAQDRLLDTMVRTLARTHLSTFFIEGVCSDPSCIELVIRGSPVAFCAACFIKNGLLVNLREQRARTYSARYSAPVEPDDGDQDGQMRYWDGAKWVRP